MRRQREKFIEYVDPVYLNIILTVILLCGFGLVMIFSTTAYTCAQEEMYDFESSYLMRRQAIFIFIGFIGIFIFQYINVGYLVNEMAAVLYVLGILMIFLLVPFGVSSHGATRWIEIVGIRFQVAEVVKFCVIAFLAYMVRRYSKYLSSVKLTIYLWVLGGGIPAVLILKISNNLSSAIIILIITYGITVLNMRTWKLHLFAFVLVVMIAVLYVWSVASDLPEPTELENMSFRIGRIAAWLEPEIYKNDQSYQTLNGLYAIGRGGWFGVGLGKSIQKLSIPEPETDMVFAIICEEMGIIGGGVVIFLFVYLSFQVMKVAICAVDINLFEAVFSEGVLLHIASQAFINIAVVTNTIPNTGIPLPFISYGGTSVFILLVEIGIVVSISQKYVRAKCGGYVSK